MKNLQGMINEIGKEHEFYSRKELAKKFPI